MRANASTGDIPGLYELSSIDCSGTVNSDGEVLRGIPQPPSGHPLYSEPSGGRRFRIRQVHRQSTKVRIPVNDRGGRDFPKSWSSAAIQNTGTARTPAVQAFEAILMAEIALKMQNKGPVKEWVDAR